MEITLNIWTLLFLFTSFHGLLLGSLLISTQQKRSYRPNRWVSALVFTFVTTLIIYIAYWNGLHLKEGWAHMAKVFWPLVFLIGPFLYLYLREQLKPQSQGFYQHFIAPVIVLLIWTPFFLWSDIEKIQFYQTGQYYILSYWPRRWTLIIASLLQMGIYVYLNFKLTEGFKGNEKLEGNLAQIHKWAQTLNIAFAIYLTCNVLFYLLLVILKFSIEWDYILVMVMTAMIYLIGFRAYNQPVLFLEREQLKYTHKKEVQVLIQPEKKVHYTKLIKTIMEEEKPYLDDQFKLVDLADRTDLSPHQLSYFLNSYMNTNFSDFINSHRVNVAKDLLLNPKKSHLKILAIGYEAGFKSKTSFYHTFKKYTGMTPTQFRNQSEQPELIA